MERTNRFETAIWLVGPLLGGLVVVSDQYFAYNFAYIWLPQFVILLLLRFFGVNQQVRLGIACTLALLPALIYFVPWIAPMHGQFWWTYMLLLPGAAIGSFMAPYSCSRVSKASFRCPPQPLSHWFCVSA